MHKHSVALRLRCVLVPAWMSMKRLTFSPALRSVSHGPLDLKQSAALWLCGANALHTRVSERVHAQAQRKLITTKMPGMVTYYSKKKPWSPHDTVRRQQI